MHDGMVMANKGFQDKLFKMYTGQSLKGVRIFSIISCM
jgi:hypothetical protein